MSILNSLGLFLLLYVFILFIFNLSGPKGRGAAMTHAVSAWLSLLLSLGAYLILL